ncbi:hypothetical protein Sango_2314200 [Sesamum angolense]|uniref:Uncharacterized protein n=1 Tax=Sesamum angolense TaxID=2727404 RepID=A0AAE1WAJ7_9LAMI|nr:hypothetical protein Sango_2314200 [Sesamum angolense]
MKKLVRDLGLPVEKIDVGKNGCMLYWKDRIDLDYYKFCGGATYKPIGERNPNSKKTLYAILSLSNSRRLIDVYLELLIEELQNLWHVGVLMHDKAKNETLMMRATLMWTVNDLPAYGVVSGWSTTSVLGCLVCMKDTTEFYLQNGRTTCYFECHKQFYPADHPYRRNKKAFTKTQVERKVERLRLTGEQMHDWVEKFSLTVDVSLSLQDNYGHEHK